MHPRELDEQVDRAAVWWGTVGISLLLVLYFVLHPTYILEHWTGSDWVVFEHYRAWLWNLPESTVGWRFRADIVSTVLYSLVTCAVAAAALYGQTFFGLGPVEKPKSKKG